MATRTAWKPKRVNKKVSASAAQTSSTSTMAKPKRTQTASAVGGRSKARSTTTRTRNKPKQLLPLGSDEYRAFVASTIVDHMGSTKNLFIADNDSVAIGYMNGVHGGMVVAHQSEKVEYTAEVNDDGTTEITLGRPVDFSIGKVNDILCGLFAADADVRKWLESK